MRVNSFSNRARRMPEQLADRFDILTFCQHQTASAVPQIVKGHFLRQLSTLERRLETTVQVARANRAALFVREHIVFTVPFWSEDQPLFALGPSPRFQNIGKLLRDIDQPLAGARFRRSHPDRPPRLARLDPEPLQ